VRQSVYGDFEQILQKTFRECKICIKESEVIFMKVYLMTDLEGVAGVMNSTDWIYPDSKYYEKGKEFLTKEVNAAIDGLFAAGATEIVVQDGHGHGAINFELLDPRAKLQRGWDTSRGGPWPFGMDESYDVQIWVGQHPKAGTEYGHLCHTGTFNAIDYRINDISVGEYGYCMFVGQLFGITPIFASGCVAFTKEAEALVPGIETVAVKEGVMAGSGDDCNEDVYEKRNWGAVHLHPEQARKLIRDGAYRALKRYMEDPASFKPTQISAPYSKRAVYRNANGKTRFVVEQEGYDSLIDLLNA